MGFSDIGAYGSEIETPNIDRLAFDGVRFTNAYNTSKCFPSRACILTGLYSQQIGYHHTFRLKMQNAITLGELFKSAGYTTFWSGSSDPFLSFFVYFCRFLQSPDFKFRSLRF